MRHNRNNRSKFADPHLPDMQISDHGIAIALDRFSDFIGQVGMRRRAIEQDPTCVADKAVSPRHHDAAAEDADGRVEPRPREKFPGDERSDGGERRKRVGQDVKIRGA